MASKPYYGQVQLTEEGESYHPPRALDTFPPAPPTASGPRPTVSYEGGAVLAGQIEGALAGTMGQPAIRLLKYQIDQALAAHDRGERPPGAIGPFAFDNLWSRTSQVARLRSASTALAALIS